MKFIIVVRKSDNQIEFATYCSDSATYDSSSWSPIIYDVFNADYNSDVLQNCWKYKYINNQYVKSEEYILELTTDAIDTDGDGYKDIPADGTSTCNIYCQKKTLSGEFASGTDEIWITTSRGTLNKIHGNLVNGFIEFKLKSSLETVIAEVVISERNAYVTDGKIQIMFRPLEF